MSAYSKVVYPWERVEDWKANSHVDNGCPWHTVRCDLGKYEIKETVRTAKV